MSLFVVRNFMWAISGAIIALTFWVVPVHAGTISASPILVGTTTAAYGQCTSNVSCGLVGYWTFDGRQVINGVFLDSSGSGNSLNATAISTTSFYAPGKIGQGIRLDGADDVLVSQLSQALPANNQFSYSFWFKSNNLTSGGILSWGTNRFCGRNGTALTCTVDGNNTGAASASTVYDNMWHHIVFVNNGATQYIYKDGILAGTATETVTAGGGTFRFGNRPSSSSFLAGDVDDVRIYNRTLTSFEVSILYAMGSNYQAGTPKLMGTTTAAFGQCTNNLACGLVGYWSFDGKDMNNGAARDLSGNGNTARLTNIATSSFYAPGRIGQGFRFDGVNDSLDAGNGSGLSPTTAITMSAWVRPVNMGATTYHNVIEKTTLGYLMYIRPDGIILMYLSGVNNWVADIAASGKSLFDGAWHHLLSTYDGSTQRIYVDSVLVASTAATGNITPTASSLTIGGGSGTFYGGLMDDVRVYNRALSTSEIAKLYTLGTATQGASPQLTATTTAQSSCSDNLTCGLVGYWSFDGKRMNNGTARDLSGNGNTVTLSNISTSTFYAPGRFGQGFNFDGTDDAANAGSGTTLDDLPAITVSLWVKARTYGSSAGGYLVSKATTASGGAGWFLKLSQTNSLISFGAVFNTTSLAVDTAINSFTTAADMNKWTHIVATWNRGTAATGVKIYKNGVEQSYSTQTNGVGTYNTDAALNLNIGDGGVISNRQSNAVLDEVRVYNRVLTAAEVRRLYGQGK